MVDPTLDDAAEKPLDPAVLQVQQRLRRLMLIAGLTLGLGILAVLIAVVYRITAMGNGGGLVDGASAVAAASIPAGSRLVSTTAANDRIVLTYEHLEGTTLIFVDPTTGQVINRLNLGPGTDVPPAK
jgi:hypothetical protein